MNRSRIAYDGLEPRDVSQVGVDLESSPGRRPGLEGRPYRVMRRTLEGRVRELKRFKHSGHAVNYLNCAAVAGCFSRLEVQRYNGLGWVLTSPVCRWSVPELVRPEDLGPLFGGL